METKMKAFVLHAPGDMRLEEVNRPQAASDEALVRMKSVGVCGSDIHYYRHGRIGPFVVREPLVLGHEGSGEVVNVGDNVSSLKIGDRVAIEPGIPCRKCWFCKNGRYTKCPKVKFMATPPIDGCLAEYVAWPEDYLFKIPDSMSFQEGAVVEPLAVGLYAVRRSGLYPGCSVVILGAGPIGLATLEAAKARAAGRIIMVEGIKKRAALALKMGATDVLDPNDGDVNRRIRELTLGEGAHFVFETAGTAKTFRQTVEIVRDGGFIVLIGLPQELEISMPMIDAVIKEVNFISSFRYNNIFEEAITLVSHNRVNMKPIITHEFPFEDCIKAFDVSEKSKDIAIKVIINMEVREYKVS